MARTKITSSQFMAIPTPAKEEAQAFLDYNNKSPTPYHAVQNAKSMLLDNGFTELTIESDWNLSKKGGYFITKGDTTIIAFLVGGQTTNGSPVALVATHTDSPSLKVKPCSKRGFGKYSQVGVTLYGGGTWYTWFDRELKLAGKVWVTLAVSIRSGSKQLDVETTETYPCLLNQSSFRSHFIFAIKRR
ncbi:hypothetical protein ACOME3_001530 [Neoechinorhynchus agilis]